MGSRSSGRAHKPGQQQGRGVLDRNEFVSCFVSPARTFGKPPVCCLETFPQTPAHRTEKPFQICSSFLLRVSSRNGSLVRLYGLCSWSGLCGRLGAFVLLVPGALSHVLAPAVVLARLRGHRRTSLFWREDIPGRFILVIFRSEHLPQNAGLS